MTRRLKSFIHSAPVICTLTFAAAFGAVGSPAQAAEGDSDRGFPDVESTQSFSQPAYEYGSAPPMGQVDESRMGQGLKASYFLPDGGAPARGQGDIGIVRWPDRSNLSNQAKIDLALFESLEEDLRTTFVDGLVLPLADGSASPVDVQFSGSLLTVTRPADGCGLADPQSPYEFQVALLGSNGFKYLADLDIDLGERPPCSQFNDEPTNTADATAGVPPVEQESQSNVETTVATGAVANDEPKGNWLPIIMAGALLVLLILGIKLTKTPRQAFKSDGTLASSQRSAPQAADDPATPLPVSVDQEPEDT